MARVDAGVEALMRGARTLCLALGLVLAAAPLRAASPPVSSLDLPDATGKATTLAGYRGRPAVVFFFRGFWCAYCVEQLVLLENLKKTDLRDVPVLAVSPDGAAAVRKGLGAVETERGVKLSHRFLCDEEAVYRDRYGLGDGAAPAARSLPTLLLLDAEGNVAWTYGESHYQKRPFDASLRAALAALAPAVRHP